MRRGDVVEVMLDPVVDGEAGKLRPCVVVSTNGLNNTVTKLGRGIITIAPMTSNVAKIHAFQVEVSEHDAMASMGLTKPSKVQLEQVRGVAFSRIGKLRGHAPSWVMYQIDDALRFHLSL
jgi:mRNA interferase MazF